MKFAEDLATMFDTDAFAQQVTLVLPAEVAGRALVGIFDDASLFVDVASGVESSAPAFTLPDSSIPVEMADALEAGQPVVLEIDGCEFTVVRHQPDGNGCTSMRLRK